MATLYCRLGTGVSQYVVHTSYSTATDPYPNGATITTSRTLSYVKDNSTVTIRASETVCESGYTFPVYVYTSTNGSSWTQVDYLQSGTVTFNAGTGTKYVRVGPATAGTTSYKVKVVLGSGIKQVGFGVNTSVSSNVASTDFTVDVGAGGRLYINIASYEDGYTYPVIATPSSGSAWTVVNANGVYNDHYISAPSSPGTRTVTLSATYAPTYYYQMHADANGGQFADGTTAWASSVLSTRGSGGAVNYDVSNFPTPIRGGYTFVGWGSSAGATTTYDGTVSFVTNATSSSSPKSVTVYAVWKKTEYTCYIKLGAGINSASVYVDGTLKSDIRDKVYHTITVNYDSTIMVSSIAKVTGYARPYIFKFYQTSTSTTPTSTLERDTDTPSYTYSTSRFYAEIIATKSSIDLFYWTNATWDAANIAKGQPISNLTAGRWNNLLAKIKELAEAEGGSAPYTGVSSGATIYAATFNAARSAISNRTGYGTLPSAQEKGDEVKAALFEGTGSLKSAINAAINHYNNS